MPGRFPDIEGGQVADGEVSHPVFARFYRAASRAMERRGMAKHRRDLLADVVGEAIEVGAGNGLNFRHYPPETTRVLAVEPDRDLRRVARYEAQRAPVPVEVVDGVADRLPAGDASFDAAVISLVLCSVPDQRSALAEIRRVLRPGGRLFFVEHVRAERPGPARVQRALDRFLWPKLCGGCRLSRDTAAAIRAGGFGIERLERARLPDTRVSLPLIIGTAIRREGPGETG
jgi:ubiquinone/menaquinone biosynthesis C-methylase UbiE